MSEENDVVETEETSVKRNIGVIVDLDYALINILPTIRDEYAKAIQEAGVNFAREAFVCKLFGKNTLAVVKDLISETEVEEAELIQNVERVVDKAYNSAKPALQTKQVVAKVLEQDIKCVFVTSRAVNVAQQVVENLGMDDALVMKAERSEKLGVYDCEVWQKAARMVGATPRNCAVITVAAESAKAAVMLGMKTIALTIQMLNYQDYSGVDYFGRIEDNNVDAIMEVISGLLK